MTPTQIARRAIAEYLLHPSTFDYIGDFYQFSDLDDGILDDGILDALLDEVDEAVLNEIVIVTHWLFKNAEGDK